MNKLKLKNGQSIVFRRLKALDREPLQAFGRKRSDATRSLFSPHSYRGEIHDSKYFALKVKQAFAA